MTKPKIALATGLTSHDGAYSAELLLDKGYVVSGVKRRPGLSNADCIGPLYRDPHVEHQGFKLHYGGPADSTSLIRILGLGNRTRICQTSATGFYGLVQQTPRAETTSFLPRNPYAVAYLYTYWITVNYPRPMAWMPSVESPTTAKSRFGARPSSWARPHRRSRGSRGACRTACTWASGCASTAKARQRPPQWNLSKATGCVSTPGRW